MAVVVLYGGPAGHNYTGTKYDISGSGACIVSYIPIEEDFYSLYYSNKPIIKSSVYKTAYFQKYFYSGVVLTENSVPVYTYNDMSHEDVIKTWYERNGWNNNPLWQKSKFTPGIDCLF